MPEFKDKQPIGIEPEGPAGEEEDRNLLERLRSEILRAPAEQPEPEAESRPPGAKAEIVLPAPENVSPMQKVLEENSAAASLQILREKRKQSPADVEAALHAYQENNTEETK